MFSALIVLIPLSLFNTNTLVNNRFRPLLQFIFWIFIVNFLFLLWLGAKPIDQPFILLGQLSTMIYFLYFFLLMILG